VRIRAKRIMVRSNGELDLAPTGGRRYKAGLGLRVVEVRDDAACGASAFYPGNVDSLRPSLELVSDWNGGAR